jgi:hypothetical protein
MKVHGPSQETGQLFLNASQREEGDLCPRIELRQDVDVARGPEILSEDRPEQGKTHDLVTTAKLRQL